MDQRVINALLADDRLVDLGNIAIVKFPSSPAFFSAQFTSAYTNEAAKHQTADHAPECPNSERNMKEWQSLFKQEYHNVHFVEALCNFTEESARSYEPLSRIYAPYFSFLQSSGMGKSRCILEMGCRKHLVVYCCVREENSTGFPLATHHPNFFMGWDERDWALYLCASVQSMRNVWADDGDMDKKSWMDYHVLESTAAWAQKVRGTLGALKKEPLMVKCLNDPSADWISAVQCLFSDELAKLYAAVNRIREQGRELPLLVFVFDEAGFLTKNPESRAFSEFRRGLKATFPYHGSDKFSCIALLTDTTSVITNFAPPRLRDPSMRLVVDFRLMPCFYLLKSIPMEPYFGDAWSIQKAFEAVQMHNVLALSRPLFWRGKSTNKGKMSDALKLADAKLCGRSAEEIVNDRSNDTESFAISLALFFSRIQLGVQTMPPVSTELVRSRMAFCSEISDDRNYLLVGYVSEPVVCEAACRLWSDEAVLERILDHLVIYTKRTNTYSKGNMGELTAMAVLCISWNKACDYQRAAMAVKDDDCFPFSRLITVRAYLTALFGDKASADIPEPLSSGVVYFSHFCKIHYKPSKNACLDFFRRGAAIICKSCELGIDLIIPVILPNSNYELTEANLAFILVQVKNRKAVDQVTRDIIFERMRPTRHSPHAGTVPYVALVMELGLRPSKSHVADLSAVFVRSMHARGAAHCEVYVMGMSKEAYPCIPETILPKIKNLLNDPSVAARPAKTYEADAAMNAYDATFIKHL